MDQERHEVYERIPWETLERQGKDRQWLVMALAAAVAVGALAFSFMRNQPSAPPSAQAPVAALAPQATTSDQTASVVPVPTGSAPAPVNLSEADLYAVDPKTLAGTAAAHAEWFAVEFLSYDGSEQSMLTLSSLLPTGLPMPRSVTDVQVFVDWVGTTRVEEVDPLTYEVEVLVRSLVSIGEEPFVRQPPTKVTVEVRIDGDGMPIVGRPPILSDIAVGVPAAMSLAMLPETIRQQVEAEFGEVLGGEQTVDGGWKVVAMSDNGDGVSRPITVVIP